MKIFGFIFLFFAISAKTVNRRFAVNRENANGFLSDIEVGTRIISTFEFL